MTFLDAIMLGYICNFASFSFLFVFFTIQTIYVYVRAKPSYILESTKIMENHKRVLKKCPAQERNLGIITLALPFGYVLNGLIFLKDMASVGFDVNLYFVYQSEKLIEKYDIKESE